MRRLAVSAGLLVLTLISACAPSGGGGPAANSPSQPAPQPAKTLVVLTRAEPPSLAGRTIRSLGLTPDAGFFKRTQIDPVAFKLKITHSVLMSFGAFAFALQAREAADSRSRMLPALVAARRSHCLHCARRRSLGGCNALAGRQRLSRVDAW